MYIFEQSAYMAHLEETEQYLQIMQEFLDRVERSQELTSELQENRTSDQTKLGVRFMRQPIRANQRLVLY